MATIQNPFVKVVDKDGSTVSVVTYRLLGVNDGDDFSCGDTLLRVDLVKALSQSLEIEIATIINSVNVQFNEATLSNDAVEVMVMGIAKP
jgi:hypothetical protein